MSTFESAPEIITKIPDAKPGAVSDTGPQYDVPDETRRDVSSDAYDVDKLVLKKITVIDHTGVEPAREVYYGRGGPIPTNQEATTPEIHETPPQNAPSHESLARRALNRILRLRKSKKSNPTDIA